MGGQYEFYCNISESEIPEFSPTYRTDYYKCKSMWNKWANSREVNPYGYCDEFQR